MSLMQGVLRTKKQRIIMNIIFASINEGAFLNVKSIYEQLPYDCSYGALRISLRFLHRHGCLHRDAIGNCNYYKPTEKGYALFRPVF